MKTPKIRSGLLMALCGVVLIASPSSVAFAATSSSTSGSSSGIKLSPLRSDVTLDPGASASVTVHVTNLTKQSVIMRPIENDFVAGDESGTPSIILDENSYAPSHSLKRFMVPLQNVTLGPGATQDVSVKITVPKTAQAGGYFGALRFTPATSGGQPVTVNGGAASLILLRVTGPTVEQMTLTNFDVQQNGGTATNFRTPNNLALLVRFQNKGNLQEAPFGQINVQKGKKVVYTSNFNQEDPKNEVLPDSARRWTVPLKNLGKFGKYTISGTFGYGDKGQTINIQKTVWIIPSAYIMAIVIAVVVIVAIVGGAWMFLRNYKRRILRSSRRRY